MKQFAMRCLGRCFLPPSAEGSATFRVAAKLLAGASWGLSGEFSRRWTRDRSCKASMPQPQAASAGRAGGRAGTAGLQAGALPPRWLFLTPSNQLGAGWPG